MLLFHSLGRTAWVLGCGLGRGPDWLWVVLAMGWWEGGWMGDAIGDGEWVGTGGRMGGGLGDGCVDDGAWWRAMGWVMMGAWCGVGGVE